jgi:hypothetical protein
LGKKGEKMKTLTLGLTIFIIFALLTYGCSTGKPEGTVEQITPIVAPTTPAATGQVVIEVPDDFVDENPDLGSLSDTGFSTDNVV